jgi:hypothetical protein
MTRQLAILGINTSAPGRVSCRRGYPCSRVSSAMIVSSQRKSTNGSRRRTHAPQTSGWRRPQSKVDAAFGIQHDLRSSGSRPFSMRQAAAGGRSTSGRGVAPAQDGLWRRFGRGIEIIRWPLVLVCRVVAGKALATYGVSWSHPASALPRYRAWTL